LKEPLFSREVASMSEKYKNLMLKASVGIKAMTRATFTKETGQEVYLMEKANKHIRMGIHMKEK